MAEKSKTSSTSRSSKSKNNETTSLKWRLVKVLLNQTYLIVAICVFISLVPLKDFPFNAQRYDIPDYDKSLGSILQKPKTEQLSYRLDDPKLTRKLFYGHPGPEAFTYSKEHSAFFTGLADGRIMKFDDKLTKIELFTRLSINATSKKCDGRIDRSNECGRPLGLEVHNGRLYVIDAVNGLYSIDIATKTSFQIPVKAYLSDQLDKETNYLYNDLRFDPIKPNICYITISTTRYGMSQLPFSLLEHENTGMLIAVDLDNKNGTIIDKELYFTNGCEISTDKQYLYVAQTTIFTVSRLNLKQFRENVYSNKGELPKLEPFLSELPGEPDNLHTNNGKIYVSFAMIRLNGNTISDHLASLPIIRNFIAKSFSILSKVLKFIRVTVLENKLNYRSDLLSNLEFQFYSGHIVYSTVNPKGGIAVYDEKTKQLIQVIASQEFGFLSHVFVNPKSSKQLIFGSFKNDFVGVTQLD